MKKRITLIVTMLFLLTVLFTFPVSAAETSGTCGESVTWSFDESTGTLTISGEGDMDNFSENMTPWAHKQMEITSVEISKGVTSIGSHAFSHLTNVKRVQLPDGLERIGSGAFFRSGLTEVIIPDTVTDLAYDVPEGESALGAFDCPNLKYVKLPDGIKRIPYGCFCSTALETLEIPDSVTVIEDYAFGFNKYLTAVVIPASVERIGWFAFGNTFSLSNIVFLGDAPEMKNPFFCSGFNSVGFYPKDNASWDGGNAAWNSGLVTTAPYTTDSTGSIIPVAPDESSVRSAIDGFTAVYPANTSYPDNFRYIINGNMLMAYGNEAFAFELSDACFGYAPISAHRTVSYDALKIGDILYFSDGAWVITEIDASGLEIAGAFSDDTIIYDYPMTRANVEASALSYRTRYGVSPGGGAIDPALSYQKIQGLGYVPTEEDAYRTIMALQADYPEGMPYSSKNHYHCNITWYIQEGVTVSQEGHGCSAFAGILSDTVFGDLPGRYSDFGAIDYDSIMVGDQLFTADHAMVVTEVYTDRVVIAEGNYDGRIHWGRMLTREEIEHDYALVTRYPEGTVPGERSEYNASEVPENPDEPEEETAVSGTWVQEDGNWLYYENDEKVCDAWRKDSVGWVYLGDDGIMKTNCWLQDSAGWCYIGADGYCETNCWKQDSIGWLYLNSEGSMTKNAWVYDGAWYYLDENGYMVTNQWRKDSAGWCYLGSSGAMLTNTWLKDSKGWCYIGADGYCETECWKQDSIGWLYLDEEGSMTKEEWVCTDGDWYYLDEEGYMVTGEEEIGGTWYTFNDSGVWVA